MIDFTLMPIEELLPHSPPMVLIHRIVKCGDDDLVAEVDIDTSSMFYDFTLEGVPTWAGIEYIAQSIAALGGIRAKRKDEAVRMGFLLGTRRFHTHQATMKKGQCYQVSVNRVVRDGSGLASFDGCISQQQELICEARVNVFEVDDTRSPIEAKGSQLMK